MKLLLLVKPGCQRIIYYVAAHFPGSTIVTGAIPEGASFLKFDYVVSYLYPNVIPQSILKTAKIAAINFHPGPPDYPGIGCTNFAIYDGAERFGVTCHHMKAQPDTGDIIEVVYFPIHPTDSVWTLTQRCYSELEVLFFLTMDLVFKGEELPSRYCGWQQKPYTRADLNELCRLTPDMSPEEVARRDKATTFPGMPGVLILKGSLRSILIE